MIDVSQIAKRFESRFLSHIQHLAACSQGAEDRAVAISNIDIKSNRCVQEPLCHTRECAMMIWSGGTVRNFTEVGSGVVTCDLVV